MNFKLPKNTEKYLWTEHSAYKMKQYGLSAQRVLRVIRAPWRKEEGIVKNTVAVMQPNKPVKHTSEIWVMYQSRPSGTNPKSQILNPKLKNTKYQIPNTKIRIISAWRYPGVSPKRNPIPEEILSEIADVVE